MGQIDEKLTTQFLKWERRGRGWEVFPMPVSPEPPFRPLRDDQPPAQPLDDGRKPTRASAWIRTLGIRLSGQTPAKAPAPAEDDEPEMFPLERGPLVELPIFLPGNFNPKRETFEPFLASLALCREPLTFEIQGTAEAVGIRLVAHPADAAAVQQQLQTFFPEVVCIAAEGRLKKAWDECDGAEAGVLEFGLGEPFMQLLATGKFEPFVGLIGALSALHEGEFGLYQVIFQPVQNRWADHIVRAVTQADGRAFFVNAPELVDEARRKTARPIYAAVVRIAMRAGDFNRAWEIARHLAGALRMFAQPNANELIPLRNDGYPHKAHLDDLLRRQSRRTGMLLNLDELLGFVHFPTAEVRSPKLLRHTTRSKAAPESVDNPGECFLGWNDHLGERRGVRLTPEQRIQHTHIIGASGTGKSTLLFNMIRQDIEAGEGLAVLDPHGDLVDKILGIIPPERSYDVILLDASDEEFSIGFNILSAHSELEKTLLASDLVSVFQRLSTSWGDQMGSVLKNAILAFLESPKGGTLADLRRFLLEPAYRDKFLQSVTDPDIVYYWRKGFSQLTGNKSVGPVLTRLQDFLSPKPIRYIVSQKENRLDFAHIMDSGKIFLAKLPKGAIGEENAYLLGSLLMAKFQQTAMSRQRLAESERRNFWLYLDEFHNFITPSTTEILTGARKYRVGLTLAHQELHQLQRDSEVASAVMSNCYTRVCFRVGDQDARALDSGFASFEAQDLQNLGTGEAVCRVQRSADDFNLTVPFPEMPDKTAAAQRSQEIVTVSRKKYAVARSEVEAALRAEADWLTKPVNQPVEPEPVKPAPPPAPAVPATPVQAPAPKAKPPASEAPSKPAAAPVDSGRGGVQHKAIQKRIKAAAEECGFRATIEKTILEGAGSVDVALERRGQAIACEITITTTIDHEVGNVAKCLKAGFPEIAVVSVFVNKLNAIKDAVVNSLGPEAAGRVGYFQPDDFIAHLKSLPMPEEPTPAKPAKSKVKTIRGYTVRSKAPELSADEARAREDEAIRIIIESMRRQQP